MNPGGWLEEKNAFIERFRYGMMIESKNRLPLKMSVSIFLRYGVGIGGLCLLNLSYALHTEAMTLSCVTHDIFVYRLVTYTELSRT